MATREKIAAKPAKGGGAPQQQKKSKGGEKKEAYKQGPHAGAELHLANVRRGAVAP